MTIPVFTAGTELTAAELNTALTDAAALPMTQANTWSEPQTFDAPIIQTPGQGANNETPFLQFADIFADQIATGLVTTTSATLSGTLTAGVAYVLGQRVPYAGSTYTVAASSTSYLDLSNTGALTVTTSGTVTANSLRLWSVTSSATAISGVTLLSPTTAVHPEVRNTLTFSTAGTTLLTEEQSSSWIRTTAAGMTINLPVTPSSGTYYYIEGNPNGTVLVSGNGAQLLLPAGVATVSSETIPAAYGNWIFVNWIDSAWRTEVVYAPIIQTPAQFDVSNLAATTAFAQQLAGNFSGYTRSAITGSGTGTSYSIIGNITTNYTITGLTTQLGPEAWGTECQIAGSVANTITYLPISSITFYGSAILFKNDSPNPQIIAINTTANPNSFIYAPAFGLGTTNKQITLQPGQTAVIMCRGGTENDVVGGHWLAAGYTESNIKSVGSTTTAGNIVLTAAQLAAGYFVDSATQTANYTFTTDTAVNILAAVFPIIVGGAFKFRFINNDQSSSGYTATLAVGTGITLSTVLPNPAIGKGDWSDYLFTCTANGATPAFTVAPIGGTTSGLL